jgi:hypothetical protein
MFVCTYICGVRVLTLPRYVYCYIQKVNGVVLLLLYSEFYIYLLFIKHP